MMTGPAGTTSHGPREHGEGILSRVATRVYWFAVVGLLLALGALPSLALLLALDRSAGNALLVPLCLLPLAPFLAAGLFALDARESADEPRPAAAFWRGLRLDWLDVLRLWAPALAVLGIIATTVVHREAAGIGAAYVVVLLVVGTGVALWALTTLLLVSRFSFRARDVARLALYYLARRPAVTVGLVALLVASGGVVWFAGELAAALLLVAWVWFLRQIGRPVVEDAEDRFTA
jgi:hypothetical protein